MTNTLENLLYDCVARLTAPGALGTGFFVVPGKLLTCAHVVSGAKADGSGLIVEYGEEELEVTSVLRLDPVYPDLALVAVTKTEHPCAELATDEEPETGDDLYTYGFPPEHRSGEAVTAKYEGRARPFQDSDKWLLKFRDGRIEGGHSGSPLLNLKTGKVCGVVKRSNTAAWGFVAAGVPAQAVWKAFPKLKTKQAEFHRQDERWANARIQARRQAAKLEAKHLEMLRTRFEDDFAARIDLIETISVDDAFARYILIPVEEEDPNPMRRESLSLGDLVTPGARVMLTGRGGSGKTTTLLQMAAKAADSALASSEAPIFLYGRLRAFDTETETFDEVISLVANASGLTPEHVDALWRQHARPVVFLLDGLNEVRRPFRDQCVATLAGEFFS